MATADAIMETEYTKSAINEAGQKVIDKTMDNIDNLATGKAEAILNAPPSQLSAFIQGTLDMRKQAALAQLPEGTTTLSDSTYKAYLKMVVTLLVESSNDDLVKWDATITSEM